MMICTRRELLGESWAILIDKEEKNKEANVKALACESRAPPLFCSPMSYRRAPLCSVTESGRLPATTVPPTFVVDSTEACATRRISGESTVFSSFVSRTSLGFSFLETKREVSVTVFVFEWVTDHWQPFRQNQQFQGSHTLPHCNERTPEHQRLNHALLLRRPARARSKRDFRACP
jgi:hypothetical protein